MKLNAFPLIVRIVPPARLPFLGSTLTISENRTSVMMVSAEILLLFRHTPASVAGQMVFSSRHDDTYRSRRVKLLIFTID